MARPIVVINPGSGPVDGGSYEQAHANALELAREANVDPDNACCEWRVHVASTAPEEDGRFAFELQNHGGDQRVDVLMPGLPLERVRFAAGQNPFAFPRIYVDGNSWLWPFAVRTLRQLAAKGE
jgi:hypothetical protein